MASPEEGTRARVMSWRRIERERLIAARLRVSVAERQEASQRIAVRLDDHCTTSGLLTRGAVVSGYWPLRGEPDLRPWLSRLHAAGISCALPVVVEKGAPLVFRRWSPGCAMEKGFWDIPVPATREELLPRVLLAPVVGFDAQCYRLGYGGGYFDRTLARLDAQGLDYHAIGIGLQLAALPSIQPLPHDIALGAVVTEGATLTPRPN